MEQELNKMGIISFAALHLLCGVSLYYLFVACLFSRLLLPFHEIPLSVRLSKWVLLTIIIAFLLLGFLLTMYWCRNILSVFLNTLTPFGIYLAVGMTSSAPMFLCVLAVLWGSVTIAYGVILFVSPVHQTKNRVKVWIRRAGQLVSGTRLLASAMLSLLTVASIVGTVFGFSTVRPRTSYTWTAQVPGDVGPWINQLQGLKAERWSELDLQQKVDILLVVVEIETYYLGLDKEPKIVVRTMAPFTMGGYANVNNTLFLNRDHLDYDPPEEVLDTILHEVRHCYQHKLCELFESVDIAYRDMIFLRDARQYIFEFHNYTEGTNDYEIYYNQSCESDAREYAAMRFTVYQAGLNDERGPFADP